MRKHSPVPAEFIVGDDIGAVDPEPVSTVFVIGDPFGEFTRRPDCWYGFLNFSVLNVLGSPWNCSPRAYKLIHRKRKLFDKKVHSYDFILDYYPAHTRRTKAGLSVPVKNFPIGVSADKDRELSPAAMRPYDVCFVGNRSRRRNKIIGALSA